MKCKPRKYTNQQIARMMELRKMKWSWKMIAKAFDDDGVRVKDCVYYAKQKGMKRDV